MEIFKFYTLPVNTRIKKFTSFMMYPLFLSIVALIGAVIWEKELFFYVLVVGNFIFIPLHYYLLEKTGELLMKVTKGFFRYLVFWLIYFGILLTFTSVFFQMSGFYSIIVYFCIIILLAPQVSISKDWWRSRIVPVKERNGKDGWYYKVNLILWFGFYLFVHLVTFGFMYSSFQYLIF